MNKTIELGKPFTPSEIKGNATKEGYAILISYGGGMGGSSQTIYTYNKVDLETKDIFEVEDIYGVKHKINRSFVVKVSPTKIVSVDIKNLGNNYVGNVGETKRFLYAISIKDKATIKNDFVSNDKVENYLISNYVLA